MDTKVKDLPAAEEKAPLLCLGFPKWEGDYLKSTVQLMSELAVWREVLYVEYPFTWLDCLRGLLGGKKAPVRRLTGWEARLRQMGPRLQVLTLPPMIPANWVGQDRLYDQLTAWNARLALPAIQAAMRKLNFSRPIVLNALQPALGNYWRGKFDERLLIYYCYDEISAAPWMNKHGGRCEQRYLPQVDLVLASSRQLTLSKSILNPSCELIANGVDTGLFSPAVKNRASIPRRNQYRRVIGYLGSVDLRLDVDLLIQVIGRMPQDLFVFVGRQTHAEACRRLSVLPNVYLPGPRPPAELPSWVNAFDVGIIPFLDNDLTRGIYPLKVNEYLAMGKPVVATRFGDMADLEAMVHIATSPEAFRQALETIDQECSPKEVDRRIAFARKNSWSGRAADLDRHIEQMLADHSPIKSAPNP